MTRVVAGVAGGRTLRTPPGSGTRPTSERVREALFSALDARDAVAGARVLDLYAGSGALGLEALSRGARSVVLVESDRRAAAVVTANVRTLGLPGARVVAAPVAAVLAPDPGPDDPADLVLLDPPYDVGEEMLAAVLRRLAAGWAAPGALVVVERSSRSPEPAWPGGLERTGRPRRYGETTLWLAEVSADHARPADGPAQTPAAGPSTGAPDPDGLRDRMTGMSDHDIPRLGDGDVLELILDDHRRFEDLLRECRRTDTDRSSARQALAEVLVAHAEAEEEEVYPTLRAQADDISDHEAEHGEEEHAEIHEKLLAFLRVEDTTGEDYDEALEDLATVVNHHSNEEEQTILNPAREDVAVADRERLGAAWTARRNQLLDEGCASVDQVAAILTAAVDEGTLAPEDAREEAEKIKETADELAEEVEDGAKKGG
ncbi:16S rRNA (guanine(966)-N(2))-methyltransferase RsmD [Phycicoccus flavus]|uniref:16S rRNA (guanine(966)-N(2))-methyltransferase RsmD n=1 Tax=Phycicoccus flavus TaxID=2502783 RepID=UPI0026924A1A|nr:16S rRNA (guanine(966)-N(2))-methyltransferase RsmD [Phycicoccus flavus]